MNHVNDRDVCQTLGEENIVCGGERPWERGDIAL